MSDLIRRKDVAEFMFNNRMCTSINNAYDQLKCIPTAHDPEKVVEQLKEAEHNARTMIGFEKAYGSVDDRIKEEAEARAFKHAIEIARGGGVD